MKTLLFHAFLLSLTQAPLFAGDLLADPPVLTSPKGNYQFQRLNKEKSEAILMRLTPSTKEVKGVEAITDWAQNYPDYKFVWAPDESMVGVVRLTFRRSELHLYQLSDGTAAPITLPDFDGLMASKEKGLTPKSYGPTLRQVQRHVESCTIENSTTVAFTLITSSVSDLGQTGFTHRFKLKIAKGKARVVEHHMEEDH